MVATKTVSLTESTRAYPVGAPVAAVAFLDKMPVVARDDGTIGVGEPGAARDVLAHPGGTILSVAAAPTFIITGGDDGRVVRTGANEACETLFASGGAWIDAVAAREDGATAFASGKLVRARDTKGVVKQISVPTTARGLAFMPKGYRLAVAHYNGASLWFPNTDTPPEAFEWKGSHIAVTVSADGRFLVTSMQENALHGWRIADHSNMRMSGYPAKVRSLAWSADGTWLATSGADSCVVWPFRDKDGPMNKAPREVAVRKAKVSKVVFNPKSPLLAIGYDDGWVLLCRLADAVETLARRPDAERHAVTALAWSADGTRLLYGTAGGEAGVMTLP